MPGQFRQAVQKKLVFRVQWLYVYVRLSFIKSCTREDYSDVLVVGNVEVKEAI